MYQFDLPDRLIAQKPANPRDSAKLLVYKLKDGSIIDSTFNELNSYLVPKTTLVLNNSKVENCRWIFNDNIEIFVLEKNDPFTIRALVKPGRKFRPGKKLKINEWLEIETLSIDDDGIRTLKLSVAHSDSRFSKYEHIPLPPYIAQDDKLANEYQTVYAKPLGSLAAPTAGLHFTDNLLNKIKINYEIAEVTLHVGLGTFAKITERNIQENKLHEEFYNIDKHNRNIIDSAEHITAVGTTSIRTLESSVNSNSGYTDIFIRPGYKFKNFDSVITNFHLPGTSLLMLIAAFIADKNNLDEESSSKELMRIYNHAIKNNYRFYSFGDAMLII